MTQKTLGMKTVMFDLSQTLLNCVPDQKKYPGMAKQVDLLRVLHPEEVNILSCNERVGRERFGQALEIVQNTLDRLIVNGEITPVLFESTRPTLDYLAGRYELGCLSTGTTEGIRFALENSGIINCFRPDLILSTVRFGRDLRKDDLLLWDELNSVFKEKGLRMVAYVDDKPNSIRAAVSSGTVSSRGGYNIVAGYEGPQEITEEGVSFIRVPEIGGILNNGVLRKES